MQMKFSFLLKWSVSSQFDLLLYMFFGPNLSQFQTNTNQFKCQFWATWKAEVFVNIKWQCEHKFVTQTTESSMYENFLFRTFCQIVSQDSEYLLFITLYDSCYFRKASKHCIHVEKLTSIAIECDECPNLVLKPFFEALFQLETNSTGTSLQSAFSTSFQVFYSRFTISNRSSNFNIYYPMNQFKLTDQCQCRNLKLANSNMVEHRMIFSHKPTSFENLNFNCSSFNTQCEFLRMYALFSSKGLIYCDLTSCWQRMVSKVWVCMSRDVMKIYSHIHVLSTSSKKTTKPTSLASMCMIFSMHSKCICNSYSYSNIYTTMPWRKNV